MSEAPETAIEEEPNNDNEEVPNKVEEPKAEETRTETPEETTKEEIKEEEQSKNKTDRMKSIKVKCEGCQAEMTLKTLRYSHKCIGKTEDKPIKPKPKAKARGVTVKSIENQTKKPIPPTRMKETKPEEQEQVIQYSEPIEVKTKAKPVRMEEAPPPKQLTARELLEAPYNEIRKAKREEHMKKKTISNQKCFN